LLYFVVYDRIKSLKEENWKYCHSKWRDERRNEKQNAWKFSTKLIILHI
jgi:hypothetical protein